MIMWPNSAGHGSTISQEQFVQKYLLQHCSISEGFVLLQMDSGSIHDVPQSSVDPNISPAEGGPALWTGAFIGTHGQVTGDAYPTVGVFAWKTHRIP